MWTVIGVSVHGSRFGRSSLSVAGKTSMVSTVSLVRSCGCCIFTSFSIDLTTSVLPPCFDA